MNKKILKSVAALSVVAVVCVTLLAVLNKLWHVSEDERFSRSVNSIMLTNGFEMLYNLDDKEDNPAGNYDKIKAFNDDIGFTDNYMVRKVRRASGGRDDGYYLFQSRGRGFNGGFVEVLIGYTPEGQLTGIVKMDLSSINDRAGNINWDTASDSVRGKTYEDEFNSGEKGGAEIVAGTQATATLGGASEAIKISNQFFKTYILGKGVEVPKSETVTDSTKIAQLDRLFEVEGSGYHGEEISQYVKYPVKTAWESSFGGLTRVDALYYADQTYVIAEVSAQLGYGSWTLLVLLDNQTNLVAAVNPIVEGFTIGDGEDDDEYYDASGLNNAKILTALYKDVELSVISSMTGENTHLQGSTHPTQSVNGLKACIAHVLKNASGLKVSLLDFITNEQSREEQNG